MLILIPNEVALVGDVDVDFIGEFGRLMKSSFFRMNPLLEWIVGDVSSLIGDLSSCDDDDDERSDDAFLRQTSRWRSMEPGKVRGGTRFCGSGPG